MPESLMASGNPTAPDFQAWRQAAAKALRGRDLASLSSRTSDCLEIEPLYPACRSAAPLAGRGGRPWVVMQSVDDPDPQAANTQAIADVNGGAGGLALRFSDAPTGAGYGLPAAEAAFREALAEIPIAGIYLRIEPHLRSADSLSWLVKLLEGSRDAAPARVSGGYDPIGNAAFSGDAVEASSIRLSVESAAGIARASAVAGTIVEADGRIYHEAGATEAQELAAVLATAVAYLRMLEEGGLPPKESLPLIGATLAADCDQFVTIAKLRAFRLLWARMAELCDAADATLWLHVETSRRMMIAADPHTNLLRTTIAAFGAGVGGADSIAIVPHTACDGVPDRFARRLARTTQLLLIEEANIHRVADPAAGSGGVETLTEKLCEQAWSEFQQIEAEGGILGSVEAGALPERIHAAREALRRDVLAGARPIVGATVYRLAPEHSHEAFPEVAAGEKRLRPIRLEAWADPRLAEVAA